MNRLLLACFILFTLLLSACDYKTQVKAWNMIDKGALVVDVRTPLEYNKGHLPNAKLIPVSEVSNRMAEFGSDKSKPIVVYCKSGRRSGTAIKKLKAAGYTNVFNGGGYSDLMAAREKLDRGEIKHL